MTQVLRQGSPLPSDFGLNGVLRQTLVRLLLCVLMAAGLLSLVGCAGGVAATSITAEPVTESDEPDARKRARLRLELASGYFEQGQTTVALDEIKQSLAADPTYGPAYVLRGLVYMRLNDNRLAEDSFQRALQINSRDPDALHNYGWFSCQLGRHTQAIELFVRALASPVYGGQAKTYMAKGVCQTRMRQYPEAEGSFARSYELDAGNPITGYNLASLLFRRGDDSRAQFYIRRLNNSELANAETLWLGIKVERRLGNTEALQQLAQQLSRRYPQSREWAFYQRGAFDE
ncbi:MAG: type IV pilus biogenesis/stability protein PilW [Hydrogenophaga sp.]|uniref:type IV pilus biogenesis/stability protein PilW n=1 Tax=Hydrogenophaga sp. TaxID=1904254 RepID=UPI0027195671|nr:type IV pilus biogenesis/stability protein PilW [Hydrogenophaga sp.]MDO9481101.1 type IV pilus biogenesis/stability protein PilW [Hydrogenophaga sp.]MDP3343024.1 type IV pilus biogenesis/stability protein PilW [Hydrogenophaga sp.]MDP3807869.1 type IV pilus biogenesis/stability protein PilW [Hydrogenophaga sp.]MDP3923481.1 type IV pilus biogenesis/stability protein PilW [Hydrogenophaga sp.]